MLALSFAVPLLVLCAYWFFFIRADYYPSRDEFSLLVASTKMFHPAISTWFLEGYSRYFLSYPGLSHPATDFIRPGANLAYYVNSLLFGANWSCYLLLSYFIQAGLVCITVKLALEALKLPRSLAVFAGVAVLLAPSFGWEQIYIPSFTIDLLGAFFVMLALHELWRSRNVTAWLLLAAAIFTKETTLFAPVMTALAVWLPIGKPSSIGRRFTASILWLTPIFVWMLLRHFAFHGGAGIYVFQNMALKGTLMNVLHGFLAWPFGTRSMQQSVRYRSLFFMLNAAFWAAVFFAVVRWRRGKASSEASSEITCMPALLLFSIGAMAMPVLLNLPQRFGASLYPLLFLTLATIAHAASDLTIRRLAVGALAASTLVAIYQKATDPLTLKESRAEWTLSRNYIQSIHAVRSPYLLLVDDSSGGFAAPDLVARFADFHGTLMRSNNIEGLMLDHCAGQPTVTKTSADEGHLALTSTLTPPCGYYAFDSLSPRELERGTDGLVTHPNDRVTLRIVPPALQPLPPSATPEMWGNLTVSLTSPVKDTVVLVPDLNTLTYHQLK
ncbi:hypothetical protein [Granulicella tundricola]|uniref:Glycosyltransferase RgtA/B/C/D-like domain-containing protein n=1 Tax=Granulicella tundricola (strain ATCC BAA-1859 / DSM 23138 / MP5ACTX9) TaxID=1198114 RepID=E8X480_GRATM|nr:hypothetical protein [Granulicella tundricola]ADW67140.1 hypothetical protein AciX9_0049 [Granulicella tundricola MP5ACTX9]